MTDNADCQWGRVRSRSLYDVRIIMRRLIIAVGILGVLLSFSLSSCKKGNGGREANIPEGFDRMNDEARVDYLVKNLTPDSVARFLVDASLGDIRGVKIDTLMVAQGYAYEKYENQPEEMAIFSSELESYSASLDLTRKKRLYAMSGMHDPEGFGYDLGLEYVNYIREKHLGVKEVTKEIAALKKDCSNDPGTYRRFVKGFKTALSLDRGKGIPEEIYQRFSNLDEE